MPRNSTTHRPEPGNTPDTLADQAPELPEGAKILPGSAWAYRPGYGVWYLARDAPKWTRKLSWCPEVIDAVRYPAHDGRTLTRRFKIKIGGHTETISLADLTRGPGVWGRFPGAVNFSGRQTGDVLIGIVTHQASDLPDIIGRPYFADGHLIMPPDGYLPDGYLNGEGSDPKALRALVRALAPFPTAALELGWSALAPAIEPLRLQPFTVHNVGDTTTGKTTVTTAAASLWGTGYKGVVRIWHGTKLSVTGDLRDLGVLPAFRDELGTAGFGPADRAVLFSTIMEGCKRAARTIDDLPRPSASWASILFSTGNISAVPAKHMSAGHPKGIIEIHADARNPMIPADLKATIQRLSNAPGMAGSWVPYAKRITIDDVRRVMDVAARVLGEPTADGLAWHMWRACSLGVAGAYLLAELTGTPQLVNSALTAARAIIDGSSDRMEETGSDQGQRLIETVAEYLSIRPAAFGLGDSRDQAHTDQIGFVTIAADGAELTCIYPAKHAEIERAAGVEDTATALRQLRAEGRLHTTKGLKYRARRDGYDHKVAVYAYNVFAEIGGTGGTGGTTPGQGPLLRSPLAPPEGGPPPGNRGDRGPEPVPWPGEPADLDPGDDGHGQADAATAAAVADPEPPAPAAAITPLADGEYSSAAPARPAVVLPCIRPGCGVPGRLYPTGAFCADHGPAPVPVPVALADLDDGQADALTILAAAFPGSAPIASAVYGPRDDITAGHWRRAHVDTGRVRAWCEETGRDVPKGAPPDALIADYLAERGAEDIPLPGQTARPVWPAGKAPFTVMNGPERVAYGPCPAGCGGPASGPAARPLPPCGYCAPKAPRPPEPGPAPSHRPGPASVPTAATEPQSPANDRAPGESIGTGARHPSAITQRGQRVITHDSPAPAPADTHRQAPTDLPPDEELAAFTRAVGKHDPALADAATEADMAAALGIFHRATNGVRWVSYAGQTGQAAYARLLARYKSMKPPADLTDPAALEVTRTRITIPRDHLTPGQARRIKTGQHVTGYDINGQYPAAAGSAELGTGNPERIDRPRSLEELANLPGYAKTSAAVKTKHPGLGTIAAGEWVPLPIVKYVTRDLGIEVTAAAALFWPDHRRHLRTFVDTYYRQGRAALADLPAGLARDLARCALKAMVNDFVGMLRSEKWSHGPYYQPAWHDMITSTAEVNAFRAIDKCAVPPIAKVCDSVYFVADRAPFEPDGLAVVDELGQLGKFKLERWGKVGPDLADAYRAGNPRGIHEAAKAADAARREGGQP